MNAIEAQNYFKEIYGIASTEPDFDERRRFITQMRQETVYQEALSSVRAEAKLKVGTSEKSSPDKPKATVVDLVFYIAGKPIEFSIVGRTSYDVSVSEYMDSGIRNVIVPVRQDQWEKDMSEAQIIAAQRAFIKMDPSINHYPVLIPGVKV